jgi:hypothetical protein
LAVATRHSRRLLAARWQLRRNPDHESHAR